MLLNFSFLKPKLILVLFLIIALGIISVFSFQRTEQVKAGAADNVSGFAWSSNIGWISFNSTNCDSDGDGITDTGNYSQCPVGLSISDYGVNIDSNGILSGYAWSSNVGWISFNRSETGTPPDTPFNGPETYIAKVSNPSQLGSGNVTVEGWARALAACDSIPCSSSGAGSNTGGWDGWIKLGPLVIAGTDYGVYVDSNGDFHNWAWAGDVIGWLSFNSAEGGGTTNYKVTLSGVNNFDFSLTASGDITVNQGDTGSNSISANLLSGTSQAVSFSVVSGLPTGATAAFTPVSCNPTCFSTLSISTDATTPTGTYLITVQGQGGGLTRTTTFNLIVNPPAAPPSTRPWWRWWEIKP